MSFNSKALLADNNDFYMMVYSKGSSMLVFNVLTVLPKSICTGNLTCQHAAKTYIVGSEIPHSCSNYQ